MISDRHEPDEGATHLVGSRLEQELVRQAKRAKRWKTAFRLLAAGNVAVLIVVIVLLFMPAGGQDPFLPDHSIPPAVSGAGVLITGSADDLNAVVNRLLASRQHENLRFGILFGEKIRLRGTLDVLGHDLEMEARFHPDVLGNGDLLLVTDSMRIGLLPAPASKILSYVRTYYELPEWIVIEDGGRQVRLRLTRMPAGEGLQFRVLEMDATSDRYTFTLSVK